MILVDTTPIVAFFDARDTYHEWAKRQFQSLDFPFNTCDAVITETLHLLSRAGAPLDPVFELLEKRYIRIIYHIQYSEIREIRALMTKYRDTPMDVADACLVRMSELYP